MSKTPARLRDDFEWSVYGYLDKSFEFLVKKPSSIPDEIVKTDALFFSYLSGYIDAEGNIRIYGEDDQCIVTLRINSEDERILRDIRAVLRSMGYHVYLGLQRRKGLHKGKLYRRDVWGLGLFRKEEVLSLLGKLSLRHPEKIKWAQLALSSAECAWSQQIGPVATHKELIRKSVNEFKREARDLYLHSHSPPRVG